MATGVEIASLVLGSIPILISALEHYEAILEPTAAFFHWKGMLPTIIRELYMTRVSYDQTIRLLLKPIASRENVDRMMDDPASELWLEGDVADALRVKLEAVYDPCMQTIKEMTENLVEIAQHLNIEGAQIVRESQTAYQLSLILVRLPTKICGPSYSELRKSFEVRKRVRFTMKRRRVRSLLQRLNTCIIRLSSFTEKAEKLEDQVPETRSRLKFTAPLASIQENASKIYQALHRSWCTSNSPHSAVLLLEQRLVRPKKRKRVTQKPGLELVAEANCFGLCFHGRCVSQSKWLDTEFRLVEQPSRYEVVLSRVLKDINPFADKLLGAIRFA